MRLSFPIPTVGIKWVCVIQKLSEAVGTPLWKSAFAKKLTKMVGVVVVVSVAFGLTIPEAKTEIICLPSKRMPEATTIFSVNAVGQT